MDMETTTRIEYLRDEAAEAGDMMQVAICHRALGRDLDGIDLDDDEAARIGRMTQREAEAECRRVLDENAAAADADREMGIDESTDPLTGWK